MGSLEVLHLVSAPVHRLRSDVLRNDCFDVLVIRIKSLIKTPGDRVLGRLVAQQFCLPSGLTVVKCLS